VFSFPASVRCGHFPFFSMLPNVSLFPDDPSWVPHHCISLSFPNPRVFLSTVQVVQPQYMSSFFRDDIDLIFQATQPPFPPRNLLSRGKLPPPERLFPTSYFPFSPYGFCHRLSLFFYFYLKPCENRVVTLLFFFTRTKALFADLSAPEHSTLRRERRNCPLRWLNSLAPLQAPRFGGSLSLSTLELLLVGKSQSERYRKA